MKKFMFKLLINIIFCAFILFNLKTEANNVTFVSVSPAMTEIIYALNAQKELLAVSDTCSFPNDVKNKEKIGSGYLLNEERIIKLKPKYILAFDSSMPQLAKFKKFRIEPICFTYSSVDEVLINIKKIAKLINRTPEADKLTSEIKSKIQKANKHNNKRILFLVQTSPMITIGSKSFITDVIKHSGNYPIGSELKISYPMVSDEYIIKQKPDVVVLGPFADDKKVKLYFPNAKISKLNYEQNDIISRPGPRIYKAVEYFSSL